MTQEMNDDQFAETLFSTKAVSIWDNSKGPVFWYAAGVPGPFYVNTEKVIGAEVSEFLLAEISKIVIKVGSLEEKAEFVHNIVMSEYSQNANFQKIISTLISKSRNQFSDSFNCVSGGERRDWFVSIPFAHEMQLDHAFLFKDHSVYTRSVNGSNPDSVKILHVADLIHNAASYFDNWLPALEQNGLAIVGTACLINRGYAGIDKLTERGIPTCSLKTIDKVFFEELFKIGLIKKEVFEELSLYFNAKEEWARQYILAKPNLLSANNLDAKSKERLENFLEKDPWKLGITAEQIFTMPIASIK